MYIIDKYEFPCFHFSITTRFLNLIGNLKDWSSVLRTWPAGDNHANCREMIFLTNKCKCMSQIVGMEIPIREGNGNDFPRLISNPDLF